MSCQRCGSRPREYVVYRHVRPMSERVEACKGCRDWLRGKSDRAGRVSWRRQAKGD